MRSAYRHAAAAACAALILLSAACPAPAAPGAKNGNEPSGLFMILVSGKVGWIDRTGSIVIRPQFNPWFGTLGWGSGFSEGLARVPTVGMDGKRGYIDKTGKMVINPQFDYAAGFSGGLASVNVGGRFTNDIFGGNWGYIDRTGKYVVNPQLDEGTGAGFSEGLARVNLDGKVGYIDKTGKIVIQPQFDEAGNFTGGLAYVDQYGDKWGYIDKAGKFVYSQTY